jgi:hypothetical protein
MVEVPLEIIKEVPVEVINEVYIERTHILEQSV